MKKCYFSFLLSILSFAGFAQQATLTGRVISSSNKQGLELANITLRSLADSTRIIGTKSTETGNFTLNNIPHGKYRISISSVGFSNKLYESYNISKAAVDLGTIELQSGDKNLKAVNIIGEKNTIEVGIDKKTFNVDKNITAAGGTAEDLLKNVPSVNVDMDGNISIRGKENVTLLVDGKPSAMFGNDIATAMRSIPAASIESIEVITNPSAKYEAQGMSGIINIIMKKDRKAGYNGTVNVGIAAPYRLNGGVNLNANLKKWNVFLNGNGRQSLTWEETTSERSNYNDNLTYSSFTRNDRKPLSGFMNAGVEFNPNKFNKFTLSQSVFNAKMRGHSVNTIENEIGFSQLQSKQVRDNRYIGNPLSFTTNLQYKHNFKKPKEELNIELNFSKMRYLRDSEFSTDLYDSNDVFSNSFAQKNPIDGGNWNATFQVDYSKPLFKNARLDLGEKTYYIRFESENQPTIQYLNQPEVPETILKNHFQYTQQVHGVYANVANQWKKTGVQLGVRGEYFTYEGTVYQLNANVNNDYLSFFPTLFITQKLSSHEDLNFNYARRVNRPGFMQLVPYIDVSNPQDTSQGNPKLNPEFIHALEMSYSYQYGRSNTFIASAYYQYTNNLIQRYRRFNNDGTTFSQSRNLATGITYGVEITNKYNFTAWWDATLNINMFRNEINGANLDPTLSRSGFGGFAKLITNAKLMYGFNAQLTGNYNARTIVSQGSIAPYGNIDIAIKKSLWKNLANLTFTVNDLFNTIQTETTYELYPYYNQTVLRKNQTRSIGLNLQVRLASKSMQSKEPEMKKPPTSNKKEKEGKNRDENLKKDEGGGDDNGGGGNKENR